MRIKKRNDFGMSALLLVTWFILEIYSWITFLILEYFTFKIRIFEDSSNPVCKVTLSKKVKEVMILMTDQTRTAAKAQNAFSFLTGNCHIF